MKLIKLILKFLVWLWTTTNFVKGWSFLYRWLYERKIITAMPKFYSMNDLVAAVHHQRYSKDGPKELWDVFHSEAFIAQQLSNGGKIGDCGSFALLAARGLNDSKKTWAKDVESVQILTVFWFQGPKTLKMGAHNVCLIKWKSGQLGHMDYRLPIKASKNDIAVVAQEVANKFHKNAQVFSWSVRDLNLKLLQRS